MPNEKLNPVCLLRWLYRAVKSKKNLPYAEQLNIRFCNVFNRSVDDFSDDKYNFNCGKNCVDDFGDGN